MSEPNPPLLELRSLAYGYSPNSSVLEEVSFCLYAGQHVGLYGANGSGKTTLFRLITGLAKAKAGEIFLHGKSIGSAQEFRLLRRHVGLVMQHAEDQLFCPTVLEDVSFGPLNLGMTAAQARERACQTLCQVGLEGFEDRLTHRLSGGEQRLVSLASVLAMRPDVLLLDEPTTGLDPEARHRLVHILQQLPTARIIIAHNWEFLEQTCTSFITISEKKLVPALPWQVHTHRHVHPLGNTEHEH